MTLQPINLPLQEAWWATHDTQWYDDSVSVVMRPTEDRAFMKLLLRRWALQDGGYWHILHEHEAVLHQLEVWLVLFLPHLNTPRARATWVCKHVFLHYTVDYVMRQWEIIELVLCDYAQQQLSLLGLLEEVWEQTLVAEDTPDAPSCPNSAQPQAEAEHASHPCLALDNHLPAMLLDDGLDDG